MLTNTSNTTDINQCPYSLNIYWLISVNISKGTFFNHEKSEPILTNICNKKYGLTSVNIG